MDRKIDLPSLRAGFRIENIPVLLLRQRPEHYVKPLHSVMSEVFFMHVLIMHYYWWTQKPFSQATATHWLCPKLLLTPSWPESVAQSLVHIFFYLLLLYLLPSLCLQWSQQSHSLLSWEKHSGIYFFFIIFTCTMLTALKMNWTTSTVRT